MNTGWKVLIASVVLLAGSVYMYRSGSEYGASVVQAKWNQQKEEDRKAADKLQREYDAAESKHRENQRKQDNALEEARRTFEVALADQRRDFDQRLQRSEQRADVYKRQAESGPAQCVSLARHAAGLDRSLEEGRSLVVELRRTLELRERELILLGQQIINDRKLFNDEK